MSGDYSRIDYDPLRDYNGVLLQQGRPLTDRDWNDLVALLDRRIQAGALDAFGGAFVSVRDARTRSRSRATARAASLIGRGRIYVDGLLAENHGTGTPRWDQRARRALRRRRRSLRQAAEPAEPARRCPRPAGHTSSISTCGSARSPGSRIRASSSRRSGSTPRRACRRYGRSSCSIPARAWICATPLDKNKAGSRQPRRRPGG